MKNLKYILIFILSGIFLTTCARKKEITPLLKLEMKSNDSLLVTMNMYRNVPSFISCQIPIAELLNKKDSDLNIELIGNSLIKEHGEIFKVNIETTKLVLDTTFIDEIGMHNHNFHQHHKGYPVYKSFLRLHIDKEDIVTAISSNLIPSLREELNPINIDLNEARFIGELAMPESYEVNEPYLALFVDKEGIISGENARLVWIQERANDSIPSWNELIVDATNGVLIEVINKIKDIRNRNTYSAQNQNNLPGVLVRNESSNPSADVDINEVHDNSGLVYNYFMNTHSRDSYNGNGEEINSVTNYRTNYRNAYWTSGWLVYGDNMGTLDIVAHEFTHAITDNSQADLIYAWQSGALSESYSDIMAMAVDDDDWTVGEGSALGIIRSISSPTTYRQPDNADNWVSTCDDSEGVHTNSGIHNRAFFNIAQDIGLQPAVRVFYRSLVRYLHPNATFEESRAGCLQAARDLFGNGSNEFNAVNNGFAEVGIIGSFRPSRQTCSDRRQDRTCAVNYVMNENKTDENTVIEVIQEFKEKYLETSSEGMKYKALYDKHSFRMVYLFAKDNQLLSDASQLLTDLKPGIQSLGTNSDNRVDQKIIDASLKFLNKFIIADGTNGSSDLSQEIRNEIKRIDFPSLIGLTYEDAWKKISQSN